MFTFYHLILADRIRLAADRKFLNSSNNPKTLTSSLPSIWSEVCPAVKLDDLVNLFLSSVNASLSISSCVSV